MLVNYVRLYNIYIYAYSLSQLLSGVSSILFRCRKQYLQHYNAIRAIYKKHSENKKLIAIVRNVKEPVVSHSGGRRKQTHQRKLLSVICRTSRSQFQALLLLVICSHCALLAAIILQCMAVMSYLWNAENGVDSRTRIVATCEMRKGTDTT